MNIDRRLLAELSDKVDKVTKHWLLMNYFLPPEFPLIVLERYDCASFSAKVKALEPLRDRLSQRVQALTTAKSAFVSAKKALYQRMKQFRQIVVGCWRETIYFQIAPLLPGYGVGWELFVGTAVTIRIQWQRIAAVSPLPIGAVVCMADGYLAADFARDLVALRELDDAVALAAMELRIVQREQEIEHEELVAGVMAYGHSARGRLQVDAPLFALIPRTWPPRLKAAAQLPIADGK